VPARVGLEILPAGWERVRTDNPLRFLVRGRGDARRDEAAADRFRQLVFVQPSPIAGREAPEVEQPVVEVEAELGPPKWLFEVDVPAVV
jgi:hypothetical protein